MEVTRQDTAIRARCEKRGDSFATPYAELVPILGGAPPSAQALAASLACVCSLNDNRTKAGAAAPLWRSPTVRSGT